MTAAGRPTGARIAAAPISWGVCEVPGWGYQLSRERVLAEMQQVGMVATEFGPDGFLPEAPGECSQLLASYGLRALGGFVTLVLHDPAVDPLPEAKRALDRLVGAGADVMVVAAVTGQEGYDQALELDATGWATLLANLAAVSELAGAAGVTMGLHPHVGTLVEGPDAVRRVLEGSSVDLCLDTGHLLIGGTDPLALTREVPDRVVHVHLKDVDRDMAARVRDGSSTYTAAVAAGMYKPLGQGDVGIGGILAALEGAGYQGYYVMEQDTVLDAEPPPGGGPIEDVRASVAFLGEVLR
ncbi:MAG: TIM barrel protein [Acidimicrobiales bacterium]